MPRLAALLLLSLAAGLGSAVCAEQSKVPLSLDDLLALNADLSLPHEGTPAGVPTSYDWQSRPRLRSGNVPPAGFSALIGWGQVFWRQGAAAHAPPIQLRDLTVLACHGSERAWVELQAPGDLAGAQFRADFAANIAARPPRFETSQGVATVTFQPGTAFHFWPKRGRARLPSGALCGIVVLVQARVAPSGGDESEPPAVSPYLIGLGADYWLDMVAHWDNHKTNKGVAVGRLRFLSPAWTWYGLSTAADADLRRLHEMGFARTGEPEQRVR